MLIRSFSGCLLLNRGTRCGPDTTHISPCPQRVPQTPMVAPVVGRVKCGTVVAPVFFQTETKQHQTKTQTKPVVSSRSFYKSLEPLSPLGQEVPDLGCLNGSLKGRLNCIFGAKSDRKEYDSFMTDSKVDKAEKSTAGEHKAAKRQGEMASLTTSKNDLVGTGVQQGFNGVPPGTQQGSDRKRSGTSGKKRKNIVFDFEVNSLGAWGVWKVWGNTIQNFWSI